MPVALVGVACRFPGGKDTEEFWVTLSEGVDAITRVPVERWDADELYDNNPGAPGKLVTKEGGFLAHIDLFDPEVFAISAREAQQMDPQNRETRVDERRTDEYDQNAIRERRWNPYGPDGPMGRQ